MLLTKKDSNQTRTNILTVQKCAPSNKLLSLIEEMAVNQYVAIIITITAKLKPAVKLRHH